MTNAFGWLPAVCEGSYVRDPVGHDDTALALLESSQFGQVMQVLGAELIPGAELALLRRGQAGDRAPADRPRGEGSRRVVEVRAAEALLPTVAPADPMTHSRLVEPVQDIEHVRSPHAVSLGQRPVDGPGLTWV